MPAAVEKTSRVYPTSQEVRDRVFAREAELFAIQEGRNICCICGEVVHEGTLGEGREAHQKHLVEAHPDFTPRRRKRTKRRFGYASKPTDFMT